VTNIFFYERATPTTAAVKAAPTPWEGKAGERARAKGVRDKDQFAIFSLIEAEAAKTSDGTYFSDGEIARRTKMTEPYVAALVQDLIVRGVVRATSGMLGRRALVPVGN
jgi:hypothetical protein